MEIKFVDCIRLSVNIEKFHSQMNNCICVVKVNCISSVIVKSFTNLNSDMLPVLSKCLIQPVLKYDNCLWGPS